MSPARDRGHRVVVVGHGMVAHRFVEEVMRRNSRVDSRPVQVTVLGEEPYHPYNRLLLSEVVAGRAEVAGLAMPETPSGVTVLSSTSAVRIDRTAGHVVDDAGAAHPFDTVVLATGAAPRVPPLAGCLGDDLPHGVMALRTVDDGRHLLATSATAGRAIVLGGGLLGVEAACALAGRGVHVTIVHAASHLMERQLDRAAAAALEAAVRDLGIDLRTGAGAVAVHTGSDGRCSAMELTDGEHLPAELVLLTVGVQPRTALAAEAGLPVDRGVLVGADLRSPVDPRVAAIGDCAQPAAGSPGADMAGLVGPGWEQAELLARLLTSDETDCAPTDTETGPPMVVRLKAAGLDVVTVSRTPTDPAMTRTLSLSDPVGRRALQVVVEGDRLVGATCVGAGALAADLVVACERGTPVPADPAHLLVRGGTTAVAEASNPTHIPDDATVCRCNGVTKRAIVSAWHDGARTAPQCAAATRAGTGCGGCAGAVTGILGWLARVDPGEGSASRTSQTTTPPGEPDVSSAKHRASVGETRAT